jgi:multicomponent Na+:H+ antiporter subunit B
VSNRTGNQSEQPSVILTTAIQYLLPLLLLFSLFLLLRGHNEPGGGFTGGLVAAAALALYALATSVTEAQRLLRVDLRTLMSLGLGCALVAGVLGVLSGAPFMTGLWYAQPLPVIGKLGTPLLFDVGVYLVVIGVTLKILFTLMTSAAVPQPAPVLVDEQQKVSRR